MQFVLFNGPPKSGKDTLADMVMESLKAQAPQAGYNFVRESFAKPLKGIVEVLRDASFKDEAQYAAFKEDHLPVFGVSGRQLMIDASESYLKPVYGEDILGRMLVSRMRWWHDRVIVLISDSGFQSEVDAIALMLRDVKIHVFQLERHNCSFEGDSRGYIESPSGAEYTRRITNNHSLADLKLQAVHIARMLLD